MNDEVYHIIPQNSDLNFIKRTVLETETGMYLVGVLVNNPSVEIPENGCAITSEYMKGCMSNLVIMFIGVFDGETYCLLSLNER